MTSILDTIKTAIGVNPQQTAFDVSLILHINGVFLTLTQIGIGPSTGYSITGKDETWADFLGTATDLNAVKSYMALKVQLLFDPPDRSAVLEAMNRAITEYEGRLLMQAEGQSPTV